MAIGEMDFRVSKSGGDFCSLSRDSMLIDDDQRESSLFESSVDKGSDEDEDGDEEYADDEAEDVASGAGSDDCDMLDLGEVGGELCQVGSSCCSIPFELYDLPDLTGVLSLETWNDCLTEEERFGLAEYLPDVNRLTFIRTLKELFAGNNFHFGSPLTQLFNMLKGGLCEPTVALYLRGLNFFGRQRHYCLLRKYQNSMVNNIIQIRDAWEGCAAYSIEEKLRLLNILRSKKSLMYEEGDMLGSETDSSARDETINGLWAKRVMDGSLAAKSNGIAVYSRRPSLEVSPPAIPLKPGKYRKLNPEGILDVSTPKASSKKGHSTVLGRIPSLKHGFEMKSRPSVLPSSLHQHDRVVGYDSGTIPRSQGHMMADDHGGEQAYGADIQKRRSMGHGVTVSNVNPLKSRKRQELDLHIGLGEEVTESYPSMPLHVTNENFPCGKKKNARTMEMTVEPVSDRYHGYGRKAKYPKKLHQTLVEERLPHAKDHGQVLLSKGGRVDWLASSQPLRHCKAQEEASSIDRQDKYDNWNFRSKKLKIGEEFKTGNRTAGLDSKIKTYRTSSPQMNESYLVSDHRSRTSEKTRKYYAQNGGFNMGCQRDSDIFTQSDETESDSSDQVYKDADIIHSTRRLGYPGVIIGGGLSASVTSGDNPGKVSKITREVKIDYAQFANEPLPNSINVGCVGEQSHMPEIEIFSSEGKKRDKLSDPSCLCDDQKLIYSSMNNQTQGDTNAFSERKLEGKFDVNSSERGSNHMHMYARNLEVGDRAHSNVSGITVANFHERSATALLRCNSATLKEKRKGQVKYMDRLDEPNVPQAGSLHPNYEPDFSKECLKGKVDDELNQLPMETSNALFSERGMADLEPETKPLKKPFTLITPSIHTGFSFSIIHLLTSVRMAMVTVHAEDASEVGSHLEKIDGRMNLKDGHDGKLEGGARLLSHENMYMNYSEQLGKKGVPSLTVQEIVDRVRSNPQDPCILETQEPLHDLVRGVLKIFSSKTAPLGAKGWKVLVSYEKSTKGWSWIGPISSSSDHETVEEETSADAWGIPHKMLVKLVDSFANWLKSGQETLKLIGSLPPPPVLTSNMDEKERFRDLRAQKSLITINPSSDEVRAYFRREEFLRYSIPDRAFSYTAADGRKSSVAPLRRGGGKPTSKARDHFILKPDRPPHVTILCLVRDAAARLPGSIGTRADVCTLLRDSQYIVEVVSDAQINQVVSGALDRLHYELDPCVQFDAERKLWVYLHRDREEEEFEDDGTSSTKKWKRSRKEHPDLSFIGGADDVVDQGTGD